MKKLHTYYVAEGYDVKQYNAGIVRNDNEKILDEEGFIALKFRSNQEGSLAVKLNRIINAVQLAFSVPTNSLVLFHFPLLANIYKWLLKILTWRGVKTLALIIDIDGLRDKDEELLKKEISLLRQFTYIAAHNDSMKTKLLSYLPAANIFSIGFFDYPFTYDTPSRKLSNSICFAGNIAKAKFVYHLNEVPGCAFNVYGPGYEPSLNRNANFSYKGTTPPHVLPAMLDGSFGLIWDGDLIQTCDEYLLYNNPHKLSLYLVAGLPVIAWKQSAIASLIEENQVGITINSLNEIPMKLDTISPSQYESMRQQVSVFGKLISKGSFLRKLVNEIKEL